MIHRVVVAALLCASISGAQSAVKPIALEVRSTVAGQVLHVNVSAHDGAAFGLAVWNGAPGTVSQKVNAGTGTSRLIVTVSPPAGRIRLAVSAKEAPIRVTFLDDTAKTPRVLGTGRTLDVVRDSSGSITVTPPKP